MCVFPYTIFFSYHYIFDIELVGFCDAINAKSVKWGFHYLGNSMGRTKTKKKMF